MKLRTNATVQLALVLFAETCRVVLAQTDEVQATVYGNAKFAFHLYSEVAQSDSGNVLISPWSVTCGLAAARIGADGETASEISKAASFPDSSDALLRGFGAVSERVQHLQDGTGVTLRRATGIWCRFNQPLLEDFAQACRLAIGAKVLDASLDSNAINQWVSEQTMGKIQNLLGPQDLNNFSRLVLVDALYFKAGWQRQFGTESTRDARFTLASGRTVEVPTMHGEQSADYCSYQGTQVLQLPYEGGGAVMLLILPAEINGLTAVEAALSVEWLKGCRKALKASTVEVALPRFKLSQARKLNSPLQRLGIVRAFTDDADFSRIDGNRTNLLIDAVFQKAYVEVNEQGTEAAVATGTHWRTRSARMAERFVCDRPFLFVIYAAKAGTILFIGRITDPTQSMMAGES